MMRAALDVATPRPNVDGLDMEEKATVEDAMHPNQREKEAMRMVLSVSVLGSKKQEQSAEEVMRQTHKMCRK